MKVQIIHDKMKSSKIGLLWVRTQQGPGLSPPGGSAALQATAAVDNHRHAISKLPQMIQRSANIDFMNPK